MSITAAYLALLTGVIVWAILVRRFTARSWELQGVGVDTRSVESAARPPAKIGLWVFLAVVTSLFALFATAYYMRMGHGHMAGMTHGDWQAISESPILWVNTVLLIASSLAMQWTRTSLPRSDVSNTRRGLALAGLLAFAFIVGQLFAWDELRDSSLFSPRNPAVAFFYVLTAIHALHLLGGLVVWSRTLFRLRRREAEIVDVSLSVELCTVYWHYLLFVWLGLFVLLLST